MNLDKILGPTCMHISKSGHSMTPSLFTSGIPIVELFKIMKIEQAEVTRSLDNN